MADRNLVLSLLITAKDHFSAIFGKLVTALNDTTNVIASKVREAFSDLFGGGIESAAQFEKTLNAITAKGGYTRAELEQLRQTADKMAATFGVTGQEVAQGMEVMAAAGLKVKDIIATLPPVLALARLEGISLEAATTKLADSLSVMGLGFEHAGRMADVLAQGANITLSSASQLADALTIAGGAAKAYGLSLEQTVALLDLLHKNGIKSSEAGTALRNILTQLLDPTSQAAQAIRGLGGDFRNINSVLETLAPQTKLTTAAILTFGAESSAAVYALRKEGVAGVKDFTQQLQQAAAATDTAATTMGQGLLGATQALAGAWDALKRNLLTPLLAPLTEQATALTQRLNALAGSKGIQQFGQVLAASLQTALTWVEKLATEGLAALQNFTGNLSFAEVAQKVADAKDNLVQLLSAGLDAATAKVKETTAGIVQTTAQLVVDIKTGLVGLLEALRNLPLLPSTAFDKLTASIETIKQGLPELAAVAQAAGEQSAQGQAQYNAALARTQQAYADLQAGAGEYERSVREGAQRMGISEQAYIAYLREHGVELQKLIPIELERFQATTTVQEQLLQQTQNTNNAQQQSVDIARLLTAAGADALEVKRWEALAAGQFAEALKIESEQRQQDTQQTQENAAASEAAAIAKEKEAAAAKQAAEAAAAAAAAEQAHAAQLQLQGSLVSDIYGGWINRLGKLSGAAVAAFQTLRGATVTATDDAAHSLENLEKHIESTKATLRTISLTETGLVGWARDTAAAALQVEQAFLAQARAADDLTQKLTAATTENGAQLGFLARQAEAAKERFDLLDQTRLEALQRAIDAARQKMEQLRQTSEDALDAAQRALLQEQGDQTALLKLSYDKTRLDLEKKITEARAANDAEAIANLQKALNLEQQAYDLKLKKLKAAEQDATKTSTGPTGSNTGGINAGGSGVTLNVNAPNARFLDGKLVEDLARQVAPVLTNINRRLS